MIERNICGVSELKEQFYNRLVDLVSLQCVQIDEPLSKHTTFKIGGAADYFVTIEDAATLASVVRLCNEYQIPYYVLGKGSNLLVSDSGYRGVILHLGHGTGIELLSETDEAYQRVATRYVDNMEGKVVYRCQAGVSLIAFALEVSRAGYTGFEYATGIPGSLGGAVTMNAGAYDGDIQRNIVEATVVDREGNIKRYSKEELQLAYRSSIVQHSGDIVTEALFVFERGDEDTILARVKELSSLRMQKQPLEYPSAGSTFKRPVGYFAGKLIMDCGLRGFTVGGAQISEKHCGFVINKGGATANDVINLIHQVQAIVKEQFNVAIETEVKFLGDFSCE